ncbi:MAG: hypothetical protein HQL55_09315 [Magnetococcales bacterium]|nr:hypothetical protein [Magnetococcales bacterium]
MGFLPPVFPVIIHNGDRPWMAPIRLRELIGLPEDSHLWKFQPDGQCFLLDEVRYRPEELDERNSLSSLLVRIGHCVTPEELPELARKVIAWMKKHPEFEELQQSISDLFMYSLTALGVKPQTYPTAHFNLEEVPTMLQTRIEHWKKERKKEWRQEGVHEGGVRSLLLLIGERFGPAPEWAKTKLASADLQTLERWTKRILVADSLDAVFQ